MARLQRLQKRVVRLENKLEKVKQKQQMKDAMSAEKEKVKSLKSDLKNAKSGKSTQASTQTNKTKYLDREIKSKRRISRYGEGTTRRMIKDKVRPHNAISDLALTKATPSLADDKLGKNVDFSGIEATARKFKKESDEKIKSLYKKKKSTTARINDPDTNALRLRSRIKNVAKSAYIRDASRAAAEKKALKARKKYQLTHIPTTSKATSPYPAKKPNYDKILNYSPKKKFGGSCKKRK